MFCTRQIQLACWGGQNPVNGMLKQKLDLFCRLEWLKETQEHSYQMHHSRAELQDVLIAALTQCFPHHSPQSTESVPCFRFSSLPTLFFCFSSVLLFHITIYHVILVWLFLYHCLSISSLLSPLHLSLMISMLSFLFFLDYDFGDIFPVLQSLPSADWEGGTLVNHSPYSHLTPPFLLSGMAILQFVLKACLVL